MKDNYLSVFRCDKALNKKLTKVQYVEILKESKKLKIDLPQIHALKQVSYIFETRLFELQLFELQLFNPRLLTQFDLLCELGRGGFLTQKSSY
jgi:hypothetical protein